MSNVQKTVKPEEVTLALCGNKDPKSRTSTSLICLSWNVHSLNNKTDEVMEHVLDFNADLVFLCELWLQSDINCVTAKVKTYNYTLLHTIRKSTTKCRGGGIGLLYSNKLIVKKIRKVKHHFESFEYGIYSIKAGTSYDETLLVSFYRWQEVNINVFLEEFSSLLEELVTLSSNIVLAGDINIHCEAENDSSHKLSEILLSFNLKQNVNQPTNKFGHIIDVVISPLNKHLVTNVNVCDVSLSDHFLVSFQLNCTAQLSEIQEITYRKLNGINNQQLSEELKISLSGLNLNRDFNDVVCNYNSCLSSLLNTHAPLKTKLIKNVYKAPWFNADYAALRRKRRKAEKLFRRTKLEIHRQHFVELRKATTKTACGMKKHFFSKLIDDNAGNTKALYSMVNKLTDTGKQKCFPGHTDPVALAKKFSTYFVEKVKNIRNNIEDSYECCPDNDFSTDYSYDQNRCLSDFVPTDIEELKSIIRKNGIKTSCADPLPQSVIEDNLDALLPAWVDIINKSLADGNFSGFKQAVITPLLKGTDLDPEDLKSYRPISNLQFLGKLIERVVLARLHGHMERNGHFIPNQYGYKPGHNTEALIVKITNDILIASDSKTATVLLLLDLSSAFDTVDKSKLISILANDLNICGNALKWFSSFLFQRTQKVKIGNHFSDEILVEFGVPQGSVLGPVLFNIYIHSLYKTVENQGFAIKGYADDHQVYMSFTPEFQYNVLSNQLKNIINNVYLWMSRFYLKLNPDKSQIIVFCSREIKEKILINGVFMNNNCIRFVENVKNLGFYLDSDMSLNKQVTEVVKSCFLSIKNISSIKHFLTYEQKRILISSLVLTKIDYCNCMYIGTNSFNLRRLQSVLNSAARLVFGCQRYESVSLLHEKLHWLPIKSRIIFKLCLYVNKCLYHDAPIEIMSLLVPSDNFTRTAKLKHTIVPETALGSRAFSFCAPKVWNSLPLSLRQETSITCFKKSLKTFLFTDRTSYFNFL